MSVMDRLITFLPVLVVAVVIISEKFRQNRIRNEYDEMQLEIRGRGAWYGFYVLILYWAVCFIMENSFALHFLNAGNAVFLGLMISGSVIVGYSILHDSYYGMNRSGSRNVYFLAVIAIVEIVAVANLIGMIGAGAFSDLTKPCKDDRLLLILCIPIFTTILITTLIRRLRPEEEEA